MRSPLRFAPRLAAAVLVLAACLSLCVPAHAAPVPVPADVNRCQLVIVVRFAGDTTGDGATGLNAPYPYGDAWRTQWEQVSNDLNGAAANTYDSQTLHAYLKKVSDGACRMGSVAPQQDAATGTMAYLTLPGTRASYSTSESVAADAVAAFAAAYPNFDASTVDGDRDGLVDNVMIVPEVGENPPTSGADPLWPRMANLGSPVTLGRPGFSAKAYTYTMVDTGHLVSVGMVVHETMHALGAKDLYRQDADLPNNRGRAVGVWDIMAEHGGSKLMWPLAVSRQDCGWTTIDEVGAGTHTLYAPGSGKTQAVKVATPEAAGEYFVLEYRRANTNIGDLSALDTSQAGSPMTIGGSGLLVYRVNPSVKIEGNMGSKDYVYLFREGDTGGPRGDGTGDVRNAQLSLGGRSMAGTTDLAKGFGDGALTCSDGQNSGIAVKVVAQGDDSITFEVSKADYAAWGVWTEAGAGASVLPSADVTETMVARCGDGVFQAVQVGVGTGSQVSAQTFDGSAWSTPSVVVRGQELKGACVCGDDRYVLTCSYGGSGSFSVYRQTGSGPWARVATATGLVTTPAFGVVGGKVYVLADVRGAAQLYRVDGGALTVVGAPLNVGYAVAPSLVEVGGAPAVVVTDFDRTEVALWRLKDNGWSRLWGRSGQVNDTAAAPMGSKTYVYLKDQDGSGSILTIKDDGSVTEKGLPASVPKALDGSLTASGGSLYLCVTGLDGNAATVHRADPSNLGSWSPVGTRAAYPATTVRSVAAGDRVYVASVGSVPAGASLRWYPVGTKPDEAGSGSTGTTDPENPVEAARWVRSGSRWWYRHGDGSYTKDGWERIDGTWYLFDPAGWMRTGWAKRGSTWYYLDGSGAMAQGWRKVGGSWYYLSPGSGAMRTGWSKVGGRWYYHEGSGAMVTGWKKVGGSWYWFDGSGAMASDRWVGNYYVTGSGAMATNAWIGRYWVDGSGRWTRTR